MLDSCMSRESATPLDSLKYVGGWSRLRQSPHPAILPLSWTCVVQCTMYINWVLHLWGGVHLHQSLFAVPTSALAESPEVIFFQRLTRARCTHFNFKHYSHWYIQCSLEFSWIQATTIEGAYTESRCDILSRGQHHDFKHDIIGHKHDS